MSQYVISQPASGDLRAIADYFAVENVEVGEHLLREFNQRCKQLASFPKMGRQYEALRPGLRGVPLNRNIQNSPGFAHQKNSRRRKIALWTRQNATRV